jgi:pyruvate dehydrogenase E2 component (dihydrolipoyllysine-residue acetyltransferase)
MPCEAWADAYAAGRAGVAMAELVVMPKLGLTMREGAVVRWLVEVGDTVTRGQPLCDIETDKITTEVEAPSSGVLLRRIDTDRDVPVGAGIALLGEPGEEAAATLHGEAPAPAAEAISVTEPAVAGPPGGAAERAGGPGRPLQGRGAVSPLARRLAGELGVDLAAVQGSGPGGRVVRRDVERAAGIAESEPED